MPTIRKTTTIANDLILTGKVMTPFTAADPITNPGLSADLWDGYHISNTLPALVTNGLTASDLTISRIPYITTGGRLVDTSALTLTSTGLMTLTGMAVTDGLALTGKLGIVGINGVTDAQTVGSAISIVTGNGSSWTAAGIGAKAGGAFNVTTGIGGNAVNMANSENFGGSINLTTGNGGSQTAMTNLVPPSYGGSIIFTLGTAGIHTGNAVPLVGGGNTGLVNYVFSDATNVIATGNSSAFGGSGGIFTINTLQGGSGKGGSAINPTTGGNTGGAGLKIVFNSGGGGIASSSATATGGTSGGFVFTGGNGGLATASGLGTSVGGSAATNPITFIGGAGGIANGIGTNTGGAGCPINLTAGNGGAATGGHTNSPGVGGDININSGNANNGSQTTTYSSGGIGSSGSSIRIKSGSGGWTTLNIVTGSVNGANGGIMTIGGGNGGGITSTNDTFGSIITGGNGSIISYSGGDTIGGSATTYRGTAIGGNGGTHGFGIGLMEGGNASSVLGNCIGGEGASFSFNYNNGGKGGNASSSTTGTNTAGLGSSISLAMGRGGYAGGSTVSNTGGDSGYFWLKNGQYGSAAASTIGVPATGGALGSINLGGATQTSVPGVTASVQAGSASGGGINVGGAATGFQIWSGAGGDASGGTSNTGGNGGTISLVAGKGGTGATANGVNGNIIFYSETAEIARFSNTAGLVGRFGIGIAPTAFLTLKAGTSSAGTAPIKLTSGTLLATPEAGALEFLTDAYYGTISTGAARKEFLFAETAATTYAKLDGTNQPFTGNVQIKSDSLSLLLGASNDMSVMYDGTIGEINTALVAPSDLKISCGTDKTLILNETVWNDSMIPATAFRTGGTGLTLAEFSGNIWMHRFDVGDIFYIQIQLPHDMKTGTAIYPHLHLANKNAIGATGYNVEVTTEHSWANFDSAFAAPTVTSTGLIASFQNKAAFTHEILNLASIASGAGTGGISSYVIFKVERIASSTEPISPATTVFVLGMDIHYEVDTIGSRTITSK